MKMCEIFFISILTATITLAQGYNILAIFHFPARSTVVTFGSFFKKLTESGHNVTVITNYHLKGIKKNYREILLGADHLISETKKFSDLEEHTHWRVLGYITPTLISALSNTLCPILFNSKEIKELSKLKFDVVMVQIFQTECVYQLAKQFKCPIIGTHSSIINSWSAARFGLSLNPAYIPNGFNAVSSKMSFWQRLDNSLMTWVHKLYYKIVMLPNDKAIVRKYFGDKEAQELEALCYNTSLFLINTHHILHSSQPLVPHVIEIGGIHIEKPKPLQKDIEKWINESKHGVIYFSFGSLVKGHTMPAEKRQAFINAFKRLPQRVIWKWENETMEGKTDNILIGKWMPQFDILSHPNVKAFISHGGLLGTFEAVHCGVPVLVMPQFGDQHTNAKAIESVGGGEILYLSDATEEKIYTALKKILSPSFQEQAKELSERFRDRPMSPLDTAIYWVEYVARHKGAHFMKTAAVGMPFYQYYLLDVIGFILAVLIIFLYVSYLILRFMFRLVFKPKHSSSRKVKKS